MCGRFTQQRPTSELAEIFDAEDRVGSPGGRFNIAPTTEAAVVVQKDRVRAVTAYRWGLIPHWAADLRAGSRMFNARAETLVTSPAFRDALRRHRCIVPVDSFYEWRREDRRRQPYRIVAADGRPLALAGLWSGWKHPETGEIVRSFTIVTGHPDAVVQPIHDRMPVILGGAEWRAWLDPELSDRGELAAILQPGSETRLEAYPVSALVNNVRFDGPELIEPLAPDRSTG
jgi:putative SOS response-associated peptidase YedK